MNETDICDVVDGVLSVHGVLLGVCGIWLAIQVLSRHHLVRACPLMQTGSQPPRQIRSPTLPPCTALGLLLPAGLALTVCTAKLHTIIHAAWVPLDVILPVFAALFAWLGTAVLALSLLVTGCASPPRTAPSLGMGGVLLMTLWTIGIAQAALMAGEGSHACAWRAIDGGPLVRTTVRFVTTPIAAP